MVMPVSETEIVPAIYAVRMDDTQYWCEKFRRKYKIAKAYSVYVYDRSRHVHCCELTPSYELNFVETQFVFEDGVEHSEEVLEQIDDERMQADADNDSVRYYHVSTIERMPFKRRRDFSGRGRTVLYSRRWCRTSEWDHAEAVEQGLEYARCNSL